MSALTNPRGPLPQRVYWFRRAVVLGVAFVLVFGAARLLGSGGDGSDGADVAARTGSDTSQRAEESAPEQPTASPRGGGQGQGQGQGGRSGPSSGPTTEPPAEPDGECDPAQVVVEPVVWRPQPDNRVRIGLDVSTTEKPACNWDISSESLTLSITSGDDDIWNTRQCPTAVPDRRAVVRSTDPARVVVAWSGRRSDDECSDATSWALPGYYHVEAAALSGEPADAQFRLKAPAAPEITRSPDPTQEPAPGAGNGRGNNNGGNNNGAPSPSPSGAVEPDGE